MNWNDALELMKQGKMVCRSTFSCDWEDSYLVYVKDTTINIDDVSDNTIKNNLKIFKQSDVLIKGYLTKVNFVKGIIETYHPTVKDIMCDRWIEVNFVESLEIKK